MKKVAVNTVKAFLKENKLEDAYSESFSVGDGNEFEVQVKANLTIEEKSAFINRVLSGCFDAGGNYRPEYVEPMIRATVLQMCTNLPVLALKNEQSAKGVSLMDLDAMNDLFVVLNDIACNAWYDEMRLLCHEAIDWKKEHTLSDRGVDSALRRLLEVLIKKADSVDVSNLMQYAVQLSEATKGMGEGDIVKKLIELKDYQAEN